MTPSHRILLAGANNYRWRAYHDRLRANGVEAHWVTSGVECIAALREFQPHVLVLDPLILWGGGDGVLAVREDDPELRDNLVMILTSGCEPSLLYRMSDYVIDDLVWQPVTATLLEHRLNRLLQQYRSEVISSTG